MVDSCAEASPGYVLVEAHGCGERVVAVLREGLGDAELDPSWLGLLLSDPPTPFSLHCPGGQPGEVSGVQVVGGSERGFTLHVSTRAGGLHARVSRRAEFDNVEFIVLEYLTRVGYRHAPRLHCYVLYEGSQYLTLTEAVEGELAGSIAVSDAAPGSRVGGRLRGVLGGIAEAAAELHRVMGGCGEDWCRAEPVSEIDVAGWVERVRARAGVLEGLQREGLVGEWAAEVADLLESRIPELMEGYADSLYSSAKMRVHGDLHLNQVIVAPGRVYLTDYEGEPYKTPASRLEKETPERDVAALLRSLDYAAALSSRRTDGRHAGAYADWLASSAGELLDSYMRARAALGSPVDPGDFLGGVAFWMLERASYEVIYEVVAQTGLHGIPASFLERAAAGEDPLLNLLARLRRGG